MFQLPTDRFGGAATQSYAWGSDMYRSPHASYAAADTPQGWRNIIAWCEHVFSNNGTYRAAMDRIVSYFLTDVAIGAANSEDLIGDDDKEKWENLLGPQLDVPGFTRLANLDKKCYGNFFASLHVPFRRFLRCAKPGCGTIYSFKEVTAKRDTFHFAFTNYEFHAKCPNCKYQGEFKIWDEPDNQPDKLSLKLWSPKEIEILHDLYSDNTAYLWRIPEDYKAQIRSGRTFHLERVSQQVLKAIKHNQLFMFGPNVMYHGKEPGPTGIRTRGWGFSPLLYNSRMIWYVELLHRYNEAIALDYVVPLRVITPSAGSTGKAVDGLLGGGNLGDFKGQINQMIRVHRRSPTSWHTLPFPVEFQQLGGDATKLAPSELLAQGYDTLLNASGTPVEMYKGTLQLQVAPVAMRLFEATHHHMVHGNNDFLSWAVERICEVLSWEAVSARYQRVSHADDMSKQMAILQLATAGRVSETTALRVLGLDQRDEKRQTYNEARYDQELQARMQEEMDQTAFGQQIAKGMPAAPGGQPGQPPGQPGATGEGGAQAPVGPDGQLLGSGSVASMIPTSDTKMTPESMQETASAIAQQLLGLPAGQRISELQALRDKNQFLHKLVKAELAEIRQNARSQGGQILISQQYGAA